EFLCRYSTRPLQTFGLVGGAMGLVGLAIPGWLATVRLLGVLGLAPDQSIGNRPLLLFGILLVFTGVQLVTLGLLAELQARTYHESQNKPIYVIREIRQTPHDEPVLQRGRGGREAVSPSCDGAGMRLLVSY